MKLYRAAIISTTLVFALGVALIVPVFYIGRAQEEKQQFMVSFSIKDLENMPQWCDGLSSILIEENVRSTVFVTGNVAEAYPGCVERIAGNELTDIGSQTYSYVSIPSSSDYLIQLQEVSRGKDAVDNIGNIDSRLFKAPFGETDENMYSLLNRSGILADFSYDDHYNKYHQGYYIWFNVTSYSGAHQEVSFFNDLTASEIPVVVNFDNHDNLDEVRRFFLQLRNDNVKFVNASDLVGFELTRRISND